VKRVRIHRAVLLTAAMLMSAPVTGHGQVTQDMGEAPQKTPAAKAGPSNKDKPAVQEPAVGGPVLAECSATEASERLAAALDPVRGVRNLRAVPGQSVHLLYRGREVNLEIRGHGACQASFRASLPYKPRPGEQQAIERAYKAVMEPAVAALAECDPAACLEANAGDEAASREQAALDRAANTAERTQLAAVQAGATPATAEDQARNAAAIAYLEALSEKAAYRRTIEIVREALPTPLTAKFPDPGSKGITITLLESTPPELGGGLELQALREKISDEVLPEELQERFRSVLAEVEAKLRGPCYRVQGYVDFQNRCGALVRGRYDAYISRRQGSDWFAIGRPDLDFPDCPGR